MAGMVMKETQARFEKQAKRRFKQLLAQSKANAKANRLLARAAGLDFSNLPPSVARQLERAAKRIYNAKPPRLSKK
jgi:hypothetical protein